MQKFEYEFSKISLYRNFFASILWIFATIVIVVQYLFNFLLLFTIPLSIGYIYSFIKDYQSLKRITIIEDSVILEFFNKSKIKEELGKLSEIICEKRKGFSIKPNKVEIKFINKSFFQNSEIPLEQILLNNKNYFENKKIKLII